MRIKWNESALYRTQWHCNMDFAHFCGKHMSKNLCCAQNAHSLLFYPKWNSERGLHRFINYSLMQRRKEINFNFMKCTCLLTTAVEQTNHFQHLNKCLPKWDRIQWNWIKLSHGQWIILNYFVVVFHIIVIFFSAYCTQNHENAFKVTFHLEFSPFIFWFSFTLFKRISLLKDPLKCSQRFYGSWILILQKIKEFENTQRNCTYNHTKRKAKRTVYGFLSALNLLLFSSKSSLLNSQALSLRTRLARNYRQMEFPIKTLWNLSHSI